MVRPFFILSCVALFSHPSCANSEYVVVAGAKRPRDVKVTFTVPPSNGASRKLVLRGEQWGLRSQVVSPRCGSVSLSRSAPNEWVLPANCTHVNWKVSFQLAAPRTVDVSIQASVFFKPRGWWLLSEPTSLLRIKDDSRTSTLMVRGVGTALNQVGATPTGDGYWRVPSANNAPEFYAFGNIELSTRIVGPMAVQYVADDAKAVSELGLHAAHVAVLKYLATVVPPPDVSARERNLLVVWIGVDEREGRAGGAAGNRSFLANYVVGRSANSEINAARTTMILGHEQFHQLADLIRGARPPLPVWLNEGLAQYYGLKALARTALPSSTTNQVVARFINPERKVEAGLLELDRRFANGERAVYPIFYEQGATFFSELDRMLLEASAGKQSLDGFILPLLLSDIPSNGKLPSSFLNSLRFVMGPELDALIERYVRE